MKGIQLKSIFQTAVFLSAALASIPSPACSDFQVKAKDNSIVIGRSMEYPVDMKSNIIVVPRGNKFTSISDNGATGISWSNKYGFLGINAFNVKDTYLEGFNEKGLSFGGLLFTDAKYQPALPGKFVTINNFGAWVLGNFATIDEVKTALPKINVAGINLKNAGGEVYLHVALHDAQGKNLVIEFINGKAKIYDNPLGVMTNRPNFDWQLTNLENYINLDAHDKADKIMNGITVKPTGVGTGMLGLPGDWTPPSRFIRLAFCVSTALPANNANDAVNQAVHILNAVDIPKGVIKERSTTVTPLDGYAQWVVIKDLTNRVLYYRTYENTDLKMVDLKKLDLSTGAPQKSLPMDDKQQTVVDVSDKLK